MTEQSHKPDHVDAEPGGQSACDGPVWSGPGFDDSELEPNDE
jgi:hypothetical protein